MLLPSSSNDSANLNLYSEGIRGLNSAVYRRVLWSKETL
jgi:hypothetical protein